MQNSAPPVILTIAGSDTSGGAGLQADLKTFAAHKCYGLCAVTGIVAETPNLVVSAEPVASKILREQIETVAAEFPISALKTGMLATKENVEVVVNFLEQNPGILSVVDPVMVATTGAKLLDEAAITVYREALLPLASITTPNLPEAAALLEVEMPTTPDDLEQMAQDFTASFRCPALIKGGHLYHEAEVTDVFYDGDLLEIHASERVEGFTNHGTGCTLSAAIASNLGLGHPLSEAVAEAKTYIQQAISQSHCWEGVDVLNHFPSLPS